MRPLAFPPDPDRCESQPLAPASGMRVTVTVRNLASGQVSLSLEGSPTPQSPQPIASGVAVFEPVTVPASSSNTIRFDAEVSSGGAVLATCRLDYTIPTNTLPCSINSTQPPATPLPNGRQGLPAGAVSVTVLTAGNSVELFANGQSQGTLPVAAAIATFHLTVAPGMLTLQATCSLAITGQTSQSATAQYLVQ